MSTRRSLTHRMLPCLLLAASLSACGHGGPPPAAAPTTPATQSLTVDAPGLYPETVVHLPDRDAFLVGSMRDGGVHQIDRAGHVRRLVDDPRLSSVLGIAVDPARDRLWVTNAELGVSTRPSVAGLKQLAAVCIYQLSTGRPLAYVELGALVAGPHLLNGIALDAAGNAYVTDSLAPVIYAIDDQARARVLVRDARFGGDGIKLNGIAVHAPGFLLVVKKSDGALFKVSLAEPATVTAVQLDRPIVAADGLLSVSRDELLVVANRTPDAARNELLRLRSDDDWRTARVTARRALGDVYPTTVALRGGRLFVLHSKLGALLQAPAAEQASMRERAVLEDLGSLDALQGDGDVERTLIAHHDLPDRPGWESRLYLIAFPPGAASPLHVHPVACVGYVLEGSFESAFGAGDVVVKRAGESFVDLPEQPHRFRNHDPAAPLRFLVAGAFPKGAPLFQPAAE